MKDVKLTLRAGTYHLRRGVPKRYEEIEERKILWISLNTDCETIAYEKAEVVWNHMLDAWEAILAGETRDAVRCFSAAKEVAARRGTRAAA